ncbi:MAG: hypothetical protein ACYDAI_19260 [Trichloromonadaceae bacterium]
MSDLSKTLQVKMQQQRSEIEQILNSELQGLSESLRAGARRELDITAVAIRLQAQQIGAEISGHLAQIQKQDQRRGWKTAGILAGILGLICASVWATTLYQSHLIESNLAEKQATLKTLETAKSWGLELMESNQGRFIVLPPGLTLEGGYSVGQSAAVKIVAGAKKK